MADSVKKRKPNLTALASSGHKAIESEKSEWERICSDPYVDKFMG
jgi:O-methyltransferase involved in polyketide biosynthesis